MFNIEINNISEDINMDALRERSPAPSPNSSRNSSIHSDTSSQIYANKVEAENMKLVSQTLFSLYLHN